jgi:hypothetical protein
MSSASLRLAPTSTSWRQTLCGALAYPAGGELDQIRFLLGHVTIQTTELHLAASRSRASRWMTDRASNPVPLDRSATADGSSALRATRASCARTSSAP